MKNPLTNGNNGRDGKGRNALGNKGGPGNPYALRIAQMRRAMLNTVSDEDQHEITSNLIDEAKQGDFRAINMLFARLFGRPIRVPGPDRMALEDLTLACMIRAVAPTKKDLLIAEMDI